MEPASAAPGEAIDASARRTDLIAVTLIALVLCSALAIFWFTSVVTPPTAADRTRPGLLISSMYDPPENAIENGIVKGDGQLFAGQATDPLVRRPEVVRGAESDLLLRETALEMGARGPRARLVEVPEVGHAPMLMEPAQIAPIGDFLLEAD